MAWAFAEDDVDACAVFGAGCALAGADCGALLEDCARPGVATDSTIATAAAQEVVVKAKIGR
tara:strand:- start:763 stop:948 length:186 start_codon:yes stop_codon:yes gene_type:complete